MKKITNLLLAASVIAFSASCNKEIDQVVPNQTAKSTVLTAHVDNGSNTRTSLNDVNVIWSANDAIVAFAGTTSYTSTNTEVKNDGLTAKFTFDGEINPTYAFYPAAGASIDENGVISSTIPTEQEAAQGTFANGASLAIAEVGNVNDIHFKNVGALVAFKINATGHNVVSMTLYGTETSGKGMTGQVAVSVDGDNVTTQCSGEDYVKVQGSITADNYYYAVIAPGTYSNVSIVFTDDQGKTATYTKDADLVINRNDHIRLGEFSPAESRWQSAQADTYYQKVTSNDDLTSGQYLIVYEDGSVAFNGSLESLDVVSNTIEVKISNNRIISNSTTDAAIFTISLNSSNSTIQSASGRYIGRNSDANGMETDQSTVYKNTITIGDGHTVIRSEGGAYLRYNATSGQDRFRYFKSSTYTNQKEIALYKLTTASPKVLDHITLSGNYPTEFYVNDTFSYEGLTVTAHFDDNSTAVVTPTSVSTPNLSQAADNVSVTVSYIYNGILKKASYSISVVERPTYYVTLSDDPSNPLSAPAGESVILPTRPIEGYTFEGYTFEGWSETNITEATTEAPEIIPTGSYTPTANITLYPVYSSGDEITAWVRTELNDVTAGKYVLISTNGAAFNGDIESGHGQSTTGYIEFKNGIASEIPNGACILTLTESGDGFTMYNSAHGYLYASQASSGGLAWHQTENSYWYYSYLNDQDNWVYASNSARLRAYSGSFRTYASNNHSPLTIAKETTLNHKTYTSNPE